MSTEGSPEKSTEKTTHNDTASVSPSSRSRIFCDCSGKLDSDTGMVRACYRNYCNCMKRGLPCWDKCHRIQKRFNTEHGKAPMCCNRAPDIHPSDTLTAARCASQPRKRNCDVVRMEQQVKRWRKEALAAEKEKLDLYSRLVAAEANASVLEAQVEYLQKQCVTSSCSPPRDLSDDDNNLDRIPLSYDLDEDRDSYGESDHNKFLI